MSLVLICCVVLDPELIKSLLLFVLVFGFLLLLNRLVLPFAGLLLSLCSHILYGSSSFLLSLLPCDGVNLLLCCWFCFCAGSLPACPLVLLVCFLLGLVLGLACCCVARFAICRPNEA